MAFAFWSGEQSRKITSRIVVEGDLVLQTPAHFGNGDGDDLTDMPLLLDPFDEAQGKERPLLTGTSIAGALRSYLREREHNHRRLAHRTSASVLLFGGLKGDDDGEQSPLIVDDALGQSQSYGIELRDGVKLDARTRTAANKTKFDLQLWQAGTTFLLRFELVFREGDNANKLKRALATALTGLTDGSITLGARKRRGYGRVNIVQWRVREYELTKVADLCAWIEHGHEQLSAQFVEANLSTRLGAPINDARTRFTINATFSLDGSLLIRSGGGRDDTGPDTLHLRARQPDGSERPVLSGTSLGGALRARASKIANTLGQARAPELIEQMFGKTEQASKVSVSEQVVRNATANLVQNRVSIDRFTGGARDTALFNEQPAFGDDETQITIDIRLINPQRHEIGLLLLLLKDLWTSDLPLGGESSVGRGRLKGKSATLTYHNGSAQQPWTITDNGQGLNISGNRTELNEYITVYLHDYFALTRLLQLIATGGEPMTREIRTDRPAVVEAVNTDNIGDVRDWLQAQATTHNLRWLLAHADDGVIWGENRNGQLVTSDSVAPQVSPQLQAVTLQQARLFSAAAELLLWRDGDNKWHARLIRQPQAGETPTFSETIDEPQILWGTDTTALANDFTLMSDGAQGLRHAVPFVVTGHYEERTRPLRLCVRHYLDPDNNFARIVASRLVDLKIEDCQ
jgi:CRISPR-associated protein (TIGR03984 family)